MTTFYNIFYFYILNLAYHLNFGYHSLTGVELGVLFLADFILFLGVIVFLITISFKTKILSADQLLQSCIKIFLILLCITFLLVLSTFFIFWNSSSTINWFTGISFFNTNYRINFSTQIIKLIFILVNLFLVFMVARQNVGNGELFSLWVIFLFLSFILVSCENFVLLLLALEGFSLILYIFAAFGKKHGNVTAVVKYFTFGTLGSIFLFWGVTRLYVLTPDLSYSCAAHLIECDSLSEHFEYITISIFTGFFIKLGAAPFHQWVADVYSGSLFIILTIFATLVKLILFILFIRIAYIFPVNSIVDFIVICSLVIGCYMTLKQTEIKRFVAYGSIVHVAFLFMGDISSSLIYLFLYILATLVFLSTISSVRINNKELIYLSDLRLLKQAGFNYVILLASSVFSLAGLPPFAGFYGKFVVWISLIEDIYLFNNILTYIVLIISIITSLISIFYYMRIIAYLFVGNENHLFYISKNFSSLHGTILDSCLFICQLSSVFFLIFWTFFHANFLELIYIVAISLTSIHIH